MIFQMASTSAYDKNEVQVYIIAEKGETIRIGDIIAIPMNDHTFEQREITAMYRDRKMWEKGRIHTFCGPWSGKIPECGTPELSARTNLDFLFSELRTH